MEVAGLVLGIAGLFSVCTEVLDKVQAYKESGTVSNQLVVRFEADKLRLFEWAEAVGFHNGALAEQHHPRLDISAVRSVVSQILHIVINSFRDVQKNVNELHGGRFIGRASLLENEALLAPAAQHLAVADEGTLLRRKTKIKWVFGYEKKFTQKVEALEFLTNKLYDLVPPLDIHPLGSHDASARQLDLADAAFHLFADVHQGLLNLLENNRQKTAIEDRRAIEDLLNPPRVLDDYDQNISRHLDGTCNWIFSLPEFTEWMAYSDSSTTTKFLWCCGPAGTGKSILAAHIVHHLKELPDLQCFYFFCAPHAQAEVSLVDIIRVWLCEIIKIDDEGLEFVSDILSPDSRVKISIQTIWTVFSKVAARVKNCVFIIDGLDEYKKSKISRQEFLVSLKDALASTGSRVLITSRDEVDLRSELVQDSSQPGLTLHHHKITRFDTEADISLYSESVVKQRLSKMDEEFQGELAAKLAQRCDGMFLWITLSGQCFRNRLSKPEILKGLKRAPNGLYSTYSGSWDTILEKPEYERTRALSILRWCLFGVRPLTVGELAEALIIDLNSPDSFDIANLPEVIDMDFVDEELIDLCNSLVEIRSATQEQALVLQTITLVHFSVKDFLLSIMDSTQAYQLGIPPDHHLELAKLCLQYINSISAYQPSDEDTASDEDSEITNEDIDSEEESVNGSGILEESVNNCGSLEVRSADNNNSLEQESSIEIARETFLNYAIRNWHIHQKASCTYDSRLCQLAFTFLVEQRQHFVSWSSTFEESSFDEDVLPSPKEEYKEKALYFAASLDLVPTIEMILEQDNVELDAPGGIFGTALQAACVYGHIASFKLLINRGASASVSGGASGSIFHAAVRYDRLEMVQELIKHDIDLNAVNSSGATPLYLACLHGHKTMVQYLLSQNADPSLQESAESTNFAPLLVAAYHGHGSIVKMLLASNVNPTLCSNDYNQTPLHRAVLGGQPHIVKILLSHGVSPLTIDSDHISPLNSAAFGGHDKIAKMLLKAGADPGVAHLGSWTPLHSASYYGYTSIVKLLLSYDATISVLDDSRRSPLMLSVINGHEAILKIFLAIGVDVNFADKFGRTAVYHAAENGHDKILKILIDAGADIFASADNDDTPLYASVSSGHIDAVRLLVSHGALPFKVNKQGTAPFSLPAWSGRLDILQLLFEEGTGDSDIDQRIEGNRTTLQVAAASGHLQIVCFLIDHGANVNLANKDGMTALHAAAFNGHLRIVQLLLEKEPKLAKVQTESTITPLSCASRNGHLETVKILFEQAPELINVGDSGFSPLYEAFRGPHVDTVSFLLEKGADITKVTDVDCGILDAMIKSGNLEAVKLILDLFDDSFVYKRHCGGLTALHIAGGYDRPEIADLLIRHGFDINALAGEQSSPLSMSAQCGHARMVRFFLERGAEMRPNYNAESPICNAAARGKTEVVDLLLDYGVDVNDLAMHDYTPIQAACMGDFPEVVRLLLGWGADLEIPMESTDGFCPIHTVVWKGNTNLLNLLIEAGADLELVTKYTVRTPLFIAIDEGHYDCVKSLLDHGAAVDRGCADGSTPFYKACFSENPQIAQLLLENGADTVDVFKDGDHPIHHVSSEGYLESVRFLIEHGVDVDTICREYGETAIGYAAERGHLACVRYLLDHGANLHHMDFAGHTALTWCVYYDHVEVIQYLLNNGAKVNTTLGAESTTLLHIAADKSSINTMRILLEWIEKDQNRDKLTEAVDVAGDNVTLKRLIEQPDSDGRTPLHYAAEYGRLNIVNLLLTHGANLEARNNAGQSPLYFASNSGHLAIVEALVAHGADPTIGNDSGATPLYSAARYGHLKTVEFLRSKDVDIDVTNEWGWTPLHIAAHNNHLQVVQFLVENGAKINFADKYGRRPLTHASRHGYIEMVDLLLDSGAELNFKTTTGAICTFLVALNGHTETVMLLHQRGAPFTVDNSHEFHKDNQGRTIFHYAARAGNVDTLNCLLRYASTRPIENMPSVKSILSTKDKFGRNLLDYASMSESSSMIQTILTMYCNGQLRSSSPWSPLHWVCRSGTVDMLEYLTEAEFECQTVKTDAPKARWSPFDLAVYYQNSSLIAAIEKTPEEFSMLRTLESESSTSRLNTLICTGEDQYNCNGCFSVT